MFQDIICARVVQDCLISLSFRKSLVHLHSEGETSSSPYHANGQIEKGKIYSRMLSVDI